MCPFYDSQHDFLLQGDPTQTINYVIDVIAIQTLSKNQFKKIKLRKMFMNFAINPYEIKRSITRF